MEKFENEIRKRLSQSQSMEGLDSEALWNSIAHSNSTVSSSMRSSRRRFACLLGSLLFVGVVVAYMMNMQHAADHVVEGKTNLSETSAVKNTGEGYLQTSEEDSIVGQATQSVSEVNSMNQDLTLTINQTRGGLTGGKNGEIESERVFENQAVGKERPTQLQLISSAASISDLNASPVNRKNKSKDKEISDASSQIGNSIAAPHEVVSNPSEVEVVQYLQFLPASLFSILPSPINLHVTAKNEVQSIPQDKHLPWSCYAGSLFVQHKFIGEGNELVDSLNADISPEVGYLAGGAIRIKQGRHWHINAGIQYMNWQDRFDKVIVSDTTLRINQSDVLAQNIRTIKHHNSADVLTFPLQMGVFKDFGCLRLGMNAGASYSFVVGQNGRLLKDASTVLEYSQANKRYANFLSIRLAPSISYMLNETLMLDVICPVSLQKHTSTSLNNLASRSVAVAPSIGLTFNY
ncbi:MAG: hypothetical protein ACK478_02680 [Flavobacteriales bacterium]|jgi:hypothetical protein